jgi:hypothetical protein
MTWMREDMVYAWKTPNARVWPEPKRRVSWAGFIQERHFVRFGSAHANALLLLEISSVRRLDSFDIEWYEGLFLRRLRAKLFAEPRYEQPYKDGYDHVANTYQYDWIDLEAAITLGKRRYYQILLSLLKEMFAEEGATGRIAAVALKTFRFTDRQWEEA